MKYVRTRYVAAGAAICDAALFLGGVPLQRTSWEIVRGPQADTHTLLLLLVGNLALLGIALCGFAAMTILTKRGAIFAVRRAATVFARPSPGWRTSTRR